MEFINFSYKKTFLESFFSSNNKVVYIEISSPYVPLTRKLEVQRQLYEVYKKNNENTSDRKQVNEDMISRRKLAGGNRGIVRKKLR